MYSGAFLYQFVLVPLGIFGTVSVCIAFAFLLPGVGNALVTIWSIVMNDRLYQRYLEQKRATQSQRDQAS